MSILTKEVEASASPARGPDVEEGDTIAITEKTLAEAGVDVDAAKRDKALQLLSNHHCVYDPNSPVAKRALLKVDLIVLPMIFATYCLMLMDKNSLSFAAIMGLKEDCHLSGSEYSWLGSILYFGYLSGDVPAMFLMQRLPLAKVVACACMMWGIVEALQAVCTNFAGLATLRFFLGFFEVFTAPAIIYIFGAWYTKEQQVIRLSIWYTCYGMSSVFGGFFAWAIYQAPSFRWRGLFVFFGALTFIVGALLFWALAASPTEAWWLTEEEKAISLERVRGNKTGTEVWRFNKHQLKEAFLDVRFWLIFLLDVSLGLPLGGISVFGPTIIANFGFSTATTTLLTVGTGGASIVVIALALLVARSAGRTIAGVSVFALSIIGTVMMIAIPAANNGARYGGYVLAIQFPNCVPFIVTFMSAGVGGTTKKLAFTAAYQLGYTVGNFIGPQTYRAQDAPNYAPAKYTMLAFLIFCAILHGSIGLIHLYWNHKRDKQDIADAANGIVHVHVENEEFTDMTDFQLRSFRYPL